MIVSAYLAGSEVDRLWMEKAASNIDADAVEWLRKALKDQDLIGGKEKTEILMPSKKCFKGSIEGAEPSIYVFISFSVPDQTWLEISREMKKIGGVFVVRGLPKNSFKLLSERIIHLKKMGLEADVQINPMLFDEYKIERVPKVVKDEKGCDAISGALSIGFALNQMAEKGDAFLARKLSEKHK